MFYLYFNFVVLFSYVFLNLITKIIRRYKIRTNSNLLFIRKQETEKRKKFTSIVGTIATSLSGTTMTSLNGTVVTFPMKQKGRFCLCLRLPPTSLKKKSVLGWNNSLDFWVRKMTILACFI